MKDRIHDTYNNTVQYCRESPVIMGGVNAVKTAACYLADGVVYVSKAIAKVVRDLINKHQTSSVPVNNAGNNSGISEAASAYAESTFSPSIPPMQYIPPESNPVVEGVPEVVTNTPDKKNNSI